MATVKKLLESYERTGSYRQTAREMRVSHNTVRKYVLRAQAAREGTIEEIVPRDREIHRIGPRLLISVARFSSMVRISDWSIKVGILSSVTLVCGAGRGRKRGLPGEVQIRCCVA